MACMRLAGMAGSEKRCPQAPAPAWPAPFPRAVFGAGAGCEEVGGPVWQQAPIRQLESASARVAICPLRLAAGRLLLPAQGPSASCGAWPGGQAESDPAFCGVPGLSLRCPAVTTGVKSLACSGPGGGFVGRWWKGEWMCVQPVACHCLLAQQWTVPTPPAPPPPCFTSFLALLVEVQPEQADSSRFGSSARHPPLAS